MSSELSTTLAEQINLVHAQCLECDTTLAEVVLLKCNKARECGELLRKYKKDCAHGEWGMLFASDHGRSNEKALFHFTAETARTYVRFAVANPTPLTTLAAGVRSLWDAMIACGALAAPAGHGEQSRTTLTLLDRFDLGVGKVRELFVGTVEKVGAVDTWPQDQRTALKQRLKPVMEIYEML